MRNGRIIFPMILWLVMTVFVFSCLAEENLDMPTLIQGNNAFSIDLFHQLATSDDNLVFSPYSISMALGMTYGGARENTANEMAEALFFKLDQTILHPSFKDLTQKLMSSAAKSDQKLNIANGLCLTGSDLSKEFKTLLQDNYDAEIFAGDVDKINDWVNGKTEGKIEKILEKVSPNSVCVLLNAIYFKGIWENQFKKERTQDVPFHVSSKTQVTVPLMYQKGEFKLLENKGFKAVSMPYKGGLMSMIALLPYDVDGLDELEKNLTAERLKLWLTELDNQQTRKIDLFIPKFKLETGYDLVTPCRNMGMKDAFLPDIADFSGMGWKKGDLWISQIKHKAFIDVNEEGTEAAAATAVEMMTKSIQINPVFRADHPFIFLIRDNATGTILFMGKIVDPSR